MNDRIHKPSPLEVGYARLVEMRKRRANANAVDQSTTAGVVYRRLLHCQIDLQMINEDRAEEIFCDEVLDPFWKAHPELQATERNNE